MDGRQPAPGTGRASHTHILLTELLTELLTSGLVMHYSVSNERLRVSNALLTSRLSMNSVTFLVTNSVT